jgi:hypothetical protein
LNRFLVSGMTAWQKCGFVFQGNEVFNPKVLYQRNAALPGGDNSRLQTRRNIVNETIETIHKILEAPTMEPEQKIFFVHVVAGRAINAEVHEQGQRYARKLNDQAAAKGKLTALEQRIVDGAVDTGAMMDEEYDQEEEAMVKFETREREGKNFKCSVCNKYYVREAACREHGNAKHVPNDNFVCVALAQPAAEIIGPDPAALGRNARGQFAAAAVAGAAAAGAAAVMATPPASPPPASPRHAARAPLPAPPRSPKKIKCMICKGYYWPDEIGKHNKRKKHKQAVTAAAALAAVAS